MTKDPMRSVAELAGLLEIDIGLLNQSDAIKAVTDKSIAEIKDWRNLCEMMTDTLVSVNEDINWMLNSRQFLNGHVFGYLSDTLSYLKDKGVIDESTH